MKYIIEKLGAFGEGVARDNGKTVFIKGALPGEEVLATVVLSKKTFSVARLDKVLVPSPDRVSPPCKYVKTCGGCSLQHLSYEGQLRLKVQTVKETLGKIAGLSIEPDKIVPSPHTLGYRNKLSFPVDGKRIGLYAENSHNVIDIDGCLLQRAWNKSLIKALRAFMADSGLRGADGKGGDIRHIAAREKGGSICVTLVTTSHIKIDGFLDYIPFENFALYQNVNRNANNVILSDEFYLIGGRGIRPDFHPASFYQVNDEIEAALYSDVLKACCGETVIDAYCGAGNLTLSLAKSAKMVYGVEICRQAVDEAIARANKNHVLNVQFICGDCKTEFPALAQRIKTSDSSPVEGEGVSEGAEIEETNKFADTSEAVPCDRQAACFGTPELMGTSKTMATSEPMTGTYEGVGHVEPCPRTAELLDGTTEPAENAEPVGASKLVSYAEPWGGPAEPVCTTEGEGTTKYAGTSEGVPCDRQAACFGTPEPMGTSKPVGYAEPVNNVEAGRGTSKTMATSEPMTGTSEPTGNVKPWSKTSELAENAEPTEKLTVIFDPPRKGVDEKTLEAALSISPQKIIYVSCNPATLARDLCLLLPHYNVTSLSLYDMFPMTPHVETMIVLQRK